MSLSPAFLRLTRIGAMSVAALAAAAPVALMWRYTGSAAVQAQRLRERVVLSPCFGDTVLVSSRLGVFSSGTRSQRVGPRATVVTVVDSAATESGAVLYVVPRFRSQASTDMLFAYVLEESLAALRLVNGRSLGEALSSLQISMDVSALPSSLRISLSGESSAVISAVTNVLDALERAQLREQDFLRHVAVAGPRFEAVNLNALMAAQGDLQLLLAGTDSRRGGPTEAVATTDAAAFRSRLREYAGEGSVLVAFAGAAMNTIELREVAAKLEKRDHAMRGLTAWARTSTPDSTRKAVGTSAGDLSSGMLGWFVDVANAGDDLAIFEMLAEDASHRSFELLRVHRGLPESGATLPHVEAGLAGSRYIAAFGIAMRAVSSRQLEDAVIGHVRSLQAQPVDTKRFEAARCRWLQQKHDALRTWTGVANEAVFMTQTGLKPERWAAMVRKAAQLTPLHLSEALRRHLSRPADLVVMRAAH